MNLNIMEGRYIQLSAGDDGVLRRNGLEPEKVRKKNQHYQHLQHISMFTLTKVSRCIRHLIQYIWKVGTYSFQLEMMASLVEMAGTCKSQKK